MQEARIDHSQLDRLAEKLAEAPEIITRAKREAIEAAAPKLKALVDEAIGGSGKVRSWQGTYVGSKGGYAAVRPRKETYLETKGRQRGARAGPKRYAVGYVTNAINQGHRPPRNTAGYYTSSRRVPGKQFYQRAQAEAEQVAQETGEQIVQALMDHLEG